MAATLQQLLVRLRSPCIHSGKGRPCGLLIEGLTAPAAAAAVAACRKQRPPHLRLGISRAAIIQAVDPDLGSGVLSAAACCR